MNFPGKKGLYQFFNISFTYHCAKNQKKPNEPFLRKLLEWHIKNQFISLISLWDRANFRVLRLIEKPCNLIGQEHLGPYLRKQNFSKYETCSSKKNYSDTNFHYRSECVHWGINPSQKHPLFLAKPPPLNRQTVQASLFRQSPPLYWFYRAPPPPPPAKVRFFIRLPKY